MHRKTKIGTEVIYVTRDANNTFKVKRSKVSLHGAGAYCGGLPHSLLSSHRLFELDCVQCSIFFSITDMQAFICVHCLY